MSKGFDLSNLNQNIQSFRQENESLAGDNITVIELILNFME